MPHPWLQLCLPSQPRGLLLPSLFFLSLSFFFRTHTKTSFLFWIGKIQDGFVCRQQNVCLQQIPLSSTHHNNHNHNFFALLCFVCFALLDCLIGCCWTWIADQNKMGLLSSLSVPGSLAAIALTKHPLFLLDSLSPFSLACSDPHGIPLLASAAV